MTGILWMIFWFFALWATGAMVLRLPFWDLAGHVSSRVLRNVLMFSVGLILYSYYWFGIGVLGWIGYPALIAWGVVSAGLIFLARSELLQNIKMIAAGSQDFLKNGIVVQGLFFLTVSLIFVTALRCWSMAIDGDSLVYHLYLPKLWTIMGKIGNFSFSEHAFWPSFLEVSLIPAQLIGSLAAAKAVSFFIYVFFAIAVGAYVFERTCHPQGAMIASASLAGLPFFFRHAPSTYNDLAFGYFAVLALLVLVRPAATSEKEPRAGIGVLAGLLMGASLACKYLGFYAFFAITGACFLEALWTRSAIRLWKRWAGFLAGAFLAGFPYYLRAFLHYHNPVFPFAQKIFHTSFGYGAASAGLIAPSAAHSFVGTGTGFLDFLMLPRNLVLYPDLFGGEKVGIFFLLFLPLILLSFPKNRIFFLFCLIYGGIWFFLYQVTRYLTPVFAVLAVMIGTGWAALESVRPKIERFLCVVAVMLLGVSALWAGYYTYKDFTGRENRGLIAAARQINAVVNDPRAKILVVGEERVYYYDFVAIRERGFRNFTLFPLYTPGEVEQLIKREGISCLLLAEQVGKYSPIPSEKFDARTYFRGFINAHQLPASGEWQSSEGIVYRLYRIDP